MSYKIPIGPYHPALEEPYKLDLTCEGETVLDAQMTIGFNFRGIEYLAERRNYLQGITLVERVCGICSNVHAMSFCQATEKIMDLEVPERALYIRTVLCELERLHSHFLWAGVAAKLIGFKTIFMACFTMREKVMDALSAISGNRVNYGMNRIGGVNRDIENADAILAILGDLEHSIREYIIPIFVEDRTVAARCKGVGILTKEQAYAMGAVGPQARASGIGQDIRKAASYAAYDRFQFQVPVEEAGDVRARLIVHALEMIESCNILRQALTTLPEGPIQTKPVAGKFKVPEGTGVSRVEAPRGEVLYQITANGTDIPTRVRVRTPTFMNMATVRLAVLGQELADSPLIQASCDPCYSCTDR
ncbi:nickel-dependent hydrogenase large subunit [Telmatobacter bradus]|uniref:hydrogenase large subunit n=1 Tax=Telmatobacter bradus TaxID=474953 RepID=UPI003B433FEF